MNGMNRFGEEDTYHPFDMADLAKYKVDWSPAVAPREKKSSTLFYETLKAVPEKSDVKFYFGRGTLMRLSESYLADRLDADKNWNDSNIRKIFVAKSYGVVDTLRTLKRLRKLPTIDLMILIDGYAPRLAMRPITKRYNGDDKRFIIPPEVKKCFCIYQKTEGFMGLLAGDPKDTRIQNTVITPRKLGKNKYYEEYRDRYRRLLTVSHFNMEEIVSILRCFRMDKKKYTLRELLKEWILK